MMPSDQPGVGGPPAAPAACPAPQEAGAGPRVCGLAGGKGGVGRSLLAANLGIQMARSGQRVVLIDLDLQGGNLNRYLGFGRLPRSLRDFATGRIERLSDLALDTSIGHLRFIGGLQAGAPCPDQPGLVERAAQQFGSLGADLVIADCGSGRSPGTVNAFARSSLGVLVTTPEPAALEGVCLFAETYLRTCMERALPAARVAEVTERLQREGLNTERAPFRLIMSRLATIDPGSRDAIARVVQQTRLELVLNQVRDEADEETAATLVSGFRKCFGLQLSVAGMVKHDTSVLESIQKRRPLAQQHPNASATRAIALAADRLLAAAGGPVADGDPEWVDLNGVDHYRVLEIVPKASSKEVQAAYQTLRKAYDPETTCLAPLLDTQELRDTLERIEASYRTLIFLESRVEYDRQLLESGSLGADDLRGLHAAPNAAGEPQSLVQGTGGPPTLPVPPLELAGSGDAPMIPGSWGPPNADPAAARAVDGAPSSGAASPPPEATQGEQAAPPTTGAGLREERLRQGQTLEAIARRTKIRTGSLQAIEEERFTALPAAVYLRGFVTEYARCLDLPGERVARGYMKRFDEWLQAHASPPGPRGA